MGEPTLPSLKELAPLLHNRKLKAIPAELFFSRLLFATSIPHPSLEREACLFARFFLSNLFQSGSRLLGSFLKRLVHRLTRLRDRPRPLLRLFNHRT